MPIPVKPNIENQPIIVDDPSREPWAGLNPCLQPGLNGELINVCGIQSSNTGKCSVKPIDFGNLTHEEFKKENGYPIPFYPYSILVGYGRNGDIGYDKDGFKFIWIEYFNKLVYFVNCPIITTYFSNDYSLDGYRSSFDNCNEEVFVKLRVHNKILMAYIDGVKYYLSDKHPKFLSDEDYFEVIDDKDNTEEDINKNLVTTGTTGDNSGNGTTGIIDNTGGLQGRGDKDDDKKQLGNGQNWYMFLIPILLWFYKKKND